MNEAGGAEGGGQVRRCPLRCRPGRRRVPTKRCAPVRRLRFLTAGRMSRSLPPKRVAPRTSSRTGEGPSAGWSGKTGNTSDARPGSVVGAGSRSQRFNLCFLAYVCGLETASVTPSSADQNSYKPDLVSSDLEQLALEVGWRTTTGSFSPDLEFEVGPPGGPYTMAASIPGKYDRNGSLRPQGTARPLGSEDHTLRGRRRALPRALIS